MSKVVSSQPEAGNRSGYDSVPDAPKGPFIQRINDDAREDEMEDNMISVSNMLGNLKSQAQIMGGEIERQNKQVEIISNKTERNQEQTDDANARAQKLLKK